MLVVNSLECGVTGDKSVLSVQNSLTCAAQWEITRVGVWHLNAQDLTDDFTFEFFGVLSLVSSKDYIRAEGVERTTETEIRPTGQCES